MATHGSEPVFHKDPWYMRLTPKVASRLKTLAVLALLGGLLLLAMALLWLLENHRT